jgi:geranylgeranyl pyrophosphate synthase
MSAEYHVQRNCTESDCASIYSSVLGSQIVTRHRNTAVAQTTLPDFTVDREKANRELDALLPEPNSDDIVAAAIRYSVFGGAQRMRPILSLRVARLLDAETPAVLRAAAATELIHCASLIVDDLPCMDDAAVRRDRPSLHVQYGESTAILASFAMVALAARCTMDPIVANGSAARLSKFQWNLLGVLDAGSLIKGQALDLAAKAPARSAAITELKTVPLFELAVEAGGVSSSEYDRCEGQLRGFARQFGLAFQMTDDYLDHELDDAEAALRQIERAGTLARGLGSEGNELMELTNYLDVKITENRRHR